MAKEIPRPVLKGSKALVVGIANDQSIAYGCAKAFRELGADLAITYLNEKSKRFVEPLAKEVGAQILAPLEQGSKSGSSGVSIEGLVNWLQSRKVDIMSPYLDITDQVEKNKFVLKPVLASN